jgi:hypothetical protein
VSALNSSKFFANFNSSWLQTDGHNHANPDIDGKEGLAELDAALLMLANFFSRYHSRGLTLSPLSNLSDSEERHEELDIPALGGCLPSDDCAALRCSSGCKFRD